MSIKSLNHFQIQLISTIDKTQLIFFIFSPSIERSLIKHGTLKESEYESEKFIILEKVELSKMYQNQIQFISSSLGFLL
jgi:hypothetical protein